MSHDFLTFDEFNRRSATPPTHTTPAAAGIAVLAGIAALIRLLDFLGYPVGLWLRRAAHAMTMQLVRAVSPAPSLGSDASDDSAHSGGMMGSLFGMGASALSKGVRGVASALSRGPSDSPPGLGNYDNSCFQNSVIQGLAALPALKDYLEAADAPPDSTAAALRDMLAQLGDPNHRGHHFWVRGKLKSMSTFTQQDAQEYYSRILDALDKEAKAQSRDKATDDEANATDDEAKARNTESGDAAKSSVSRPLPLEGSLAQRVGCTTCGYSEGLSLIPFNCITVSLGRRNAYDIRELLDDHTSLEYIDGVECSKCTLLKLKNTLAPVVEAKGADSPFGARLRLVQDALDDEDLKDSTLIKTLNIPKKNWVKSEKSKQVVVARAPKSLVLHVNRSIFDETTFAQYKNNAGVAYPSTLDLRKWCLGAAPSGTEKPDLDPKTEEWPRDPKKSMLEDVDEDAPSPFQYRLRAAVTHFGTHGNGHYVCYRPHPRPVKADVEVEAKENAHDVSEADVKEAADASEAVEASTEEVDASDETPSTSSETKLDETEDEKEDEPEKNEQQEKEESLEKNDSEQQTPTEEQWYRFSDDTVYPIPEQQAHQGSVFMLFYERIDPSTPSTPTLPQTTPSTAPVNTTPTVDTTLTSEHIPSDPTPAPDSEPSASDPDSDTELPRSLPQASPHTMRTAGAASSRNTGSRKSLPLVSAT